MGAGIRGATGLKITLAYKTIYLAQIHLLPQSSCAGKGSKHRLACRGRSLIVPFLVHEGEVKVLMVYFEKNLEIVNI